MRERGEGEGGREREGREGGREGGRDSVCVCVCVCVCVWYMYVCKLVYVTKRRTTLLTTTAPCVVSTNELFMRTTCM